jgi:hypothetical protein
MTDAQDMMISKLQKVGFQGKRRVWAMGDTVIAFRKYINHDDGIQAFDGYICIYPIGDKWGHVLGWINADVYNTADEAVDAAIELLRKSNDELSAICKQIYKKRG